MPNSQKPAGSRKQQRHILLQGQANFRDLGGYRTGDGRTVKCGERIPTTHS